jgi:putative MFS transporter
MSLGLAIRFTGLDYRSPTPCWIDLNTAPLDFWASIRGKPLTTFLICLGAYGLSQAELAMFSYAVPPLRAEFDLSRQEMAKVVGVAYLLGGVLQIWFGHLTDRIGRKTMLQVSLGGASLVVAAHALAASATWLTLLRAGAIFTGGALYPATGAIVTEVAPARYRGILAGLLQTAYPLGWFVAALAAAPLLAHFGWRAMFLFALLSLPYLLVVRFWLRESDRFASAREATRERSLSASIRALFQPGMRRRTVILLVAQLLFTMAYGGLSVWFPSYLMEERGMPIGTSTILVGFGNLIAVLGYIAAALVGEFVLTRRSTVVAWTLLGTISLLALIWGTAGYWPTLLGFGLMSMFLYGTAAVKFAFVAELFPTSLRATGLAVCSSLPVNLGIATGPAVVAYCVDRLGWNAALSLAVGIPLAAAGLLYLLLKPIPSGLDLDAVQSRLAS